MSRAAISQRVAFGVSLAALMVALPLTMRAGALSRASDQARVEGLVPSERANARVEGQQLRLGRARRNRRRSTDTSPRRIRASRWKAVRGPAGGEGMTATLLEMTSQRWLTEQEVERPLWTHWLVVVTSGEGDERRRAALHHRRQQSIAQPPARRRPGWSRPPATPAR